MQYIKTHRLVLFITTICLVVLSTGCKFSPPIASNKNKTYVHQTAAEISKYQLAQEPEFRKTQKQKLSQFSSSPSASIHISFFHYLNPAELTSLMQNSGLETINTINLRLVNVPTWNTITMEIPKLTLRSSDLATTNILSLVEARLAGEEEDVRAALHTLSPTDVHIFAVGGIGNPAKILSWWNANSESIRLIYVNPLGYTGYPSAPEPDIPLDFPVPLKEFTSSTQP